MTPTRDPAAPLRAIPGAAAEPGPAPAGSGHLAGSEAPPASLPAGTDVIAAKLLEAYLDDQIRGICADLGLLRYHTHDSRRSAAGFPDLVIVGRRVMYRELKKQDGKTTKAQTAWLEALCAAGADAGIWRPSDLLSGRIARELAALAGIRGRS